MVERIIEVSNTLAKVLLNVDALVIDVNKHVSISFVQVPDLMNDIRQMVGEFSIAARDLGKLTHDLDQNVWEISQGKLQAISRLNQTMQQAQTALGSVADALGNRSPLQYQINQALAEITAAASAMRILSEYLQQNLRVLLSGKGAP